jgi:hypothetical protein
MNRADMTKWALLEDNYRVYSHHNNIKIFVANFDTVLEYDCGNIFKGYISSLKNVEQFPTIIRKVIEKNKTSWLIYVVQKNLCRNINLPMYLYNSVASANMARTLNGLVKINPNKVCKDNLFRKALNDNNYDLIEWYTQAGLVPSIECSNEIIEKYPNQALLILWESLDVNYIYPQTAIYQLIKNKIFIKCRVVLQKMVDNNQKSETRQMRDLSTIFALCEEFRQTDILLLLIETRFCRYEDMICAALMSESVNMLKWIHDHRRHMKCDTSIRYDYKWFHESFRRREYKERVALRSLVELAHKLGVPRDPWFNSESSMF